MREVVSERASGESLGFWEEFAQERAISVYSTPNKKIPHFSQDSHPILRF